MKKPTSTIKNARKLALTRETLRKLSEAELAATPGGRNSEMCSGDEGCPMTWTCMSG